MMTTINLLPDIRQAKLRERKRRQTISAVAVATWVACGAIVLILSLVTASQKVLIGAQSNKVHGKEEQLRGVVGLNDALTAQQHLDSLPGLYGQRVYMTKFFQALAQSDPSDITLATVNVDSLNTLTVSGDARAYASVAKLARALQQSNVTIGANRTNTPYFTDVAITEASEASKTGVSFTIQATMLPEVVAAPAGVSNATSN